MPYFNPRRWLKEAKISASMMCLGMRRETFFFNQMRVNHDIIVSSVSDFKIDDITFEVGGKTKKQKQIKNIPNSFVVKDDIEMGYKNVIPLWQFGLEY